MLSNQNSRSSILLSSFRVGEQLAEIDDRMELSGQSHPTGTSSATKKSSIRRSFRKFMEKSFLPKLTSTLKKSSSTFKPRIKANGLPNSDDPSLDSIRQNTGSRAISTTSNTVDYSSDCLTISNNGGSGIKSIYYNWKFITATKTMDDSTMRCLNFVEGQNFYLLEEENPDWFVVKDTLSNSVGRVPSQYFIPSYKYHHCSVWFHPDMSRSEVESLLSNETTPGIFIVRNSETCRDQFSLSVLYRFRDVKHYKIRVVNEHTNNQGFYLHQSKLFLNLVQLINHYSTLDDGICCQLSPLLTQSFVDARYVNIYNSRHQHRQNTIPTKLPQEIDTKKYLLNFDWTSFNYDDVVLKNKLGKGNFGAVWLGMIPNQQRVFAIKILNDTTPKSVRLFKNEIAILSTLNHPKIIKYYSSVIGDHCGRYWIVTSLMKGGNLMDFLRSQTNRAHIRFPELMNVVSQICSGMLYLEDNFIIHRDLAARNILVGESWKAVCICDFGMACKVESLLGVPKLATTEITGKADPNAEDDHSVFALKWMAPEAALHKEFSLKSDVWSFGILIHEIVTYGQHPYVGMTNKETIERVVNGYRLPQPVCCPNSIYNVMLSCWAQNPLLRPNFECLLSYFTKVTLVLKYHYLNK